MTQSYISLSLLLLLAAVAHADSSAGAAASFLHAPLHPLLASRGPWPTAHGDAWATDTSPYPGPSNSSLSSSVVSVYGIWNNSYLPISLVFGDDYVWGTSISSTLLLSDKNGPLTIVDTFWNGGFDFSYHGSYSFVTADGVYFSSSKKGFYAFATSVVDGHPKIVKRGQFELPFRPAYPNEVVVAVQEFYPHASDAKAKNKGLVAVATSAGLVAVVSRSSALGADGLEVFKVEATLQLPRTTEFPSDSFVSNSIALDQNGGVYVVSATHLTRVQWSPDDLALSISWHTPYAPPAGDPLLPGRLGRGSGSTPSLMYGEGALPGSAPSYVIITDGASPMSVLLFSAADGAIAARSTVKFASSKDSTSEQSIVVLGQRAVVVQNWIPYDRLPLPCKALASAPSFIGKLLPGKVLNACANLLGAYPLSGVAQFEVKQAQKGGPVALHMTWMDDNVQCSSCIPAASSTALGETGALDDAMFYCLGMEDRQQGPKREGFLGLVTKAVNDFLLPSAAYTIEGLSWADGRQIVKTTLGTGTKFNPSYAAVQIGRKRDLIVGTVSGVLHVSYDHRVLPEPKSALRVWKAEEIADYLCTHFSVHTAIALSVAPTLLFATIVAVIATKALGGKK